MIDNQNISMDTEEIKDWLFELATGAEILGRNHSYEKQSELARKCLEIIQKEQFALL